MNARITKLKEKIKKLEEQRDDACKLAEKAAKNRHYLCRRIADLEQALNNIVALAQKFELDKLNTKFYTLLLLETVRSKKELVDNTP